MNTATADGRARARFVHLLDLDPELGDGLPDASQREARARLVAPIVELPSGDFDPAQVARAGGDTFALMVADGLVVREIELVGTPSAALLGPADLLPRAATSDRLLAFGERWHVSSGATLAVLDERLLPALHRWPSLGACLVVRAARQARRAAEHRAIAQLPRVELRLRALLWHLAERWGRVGAGGIVLPLELTHDALGRLVGARRPTVTLAVGALQREGLVVRRADGAWVLPHGTNPAPSATGFRRGPADARVVAVPEPPLDSGRQRAAGVSVGDLAALSERVRRQIEASEHQARMTSGILQRCSATREQVRGTRRRVRSPASTPR